MAIQAGGIELGLALNTASFNKSIKTANNSVKNFVNGVSSAGSSVSGLSKGLTGVGVAAGATGYALTRMSKAAFQVAADVAEMNVAMEAVGKSTGIGGAAIKGAAKDIRKMGIEMKASQEIALLFVKGKLDLAKADDLARVAQDLAVLSQSNSTDTAQTLTYAIQNGNSMLLKSAGITKYASEAYAQYARELKISQTALTASQRQQAILNMVLEEGKKVAGTYEAAMTQSGKVLRSFPRIINDIQLEFGGLFLDGFGPVILAAYKTLQAFSLLIREGGTLRPIIDALTNTFQIMIQPLKGVFDGMTNSLKLFDGLSMSTQQLTDNFVALTPIILSASTALALLAGKNILAGLPVIGKYAQAFGRGGPLGVGLALLIATSPKLRGVFANILAGTKPLVPAFMNLAKSISNVAMTAGEIAGKLAVAFEGTLVTIISAAAIAFYALSKGILAVVTPVLDLTNRIMENAKVVKVLASIIGAVLIAKFALMIASMGGVVGAITKVIISHNALGSTFRMNMVRMAIANTTGWAQIKGAMALSLTSMKIALKSFSATLMTTFLPLLAITAIVYGLMKAFTAFSSRNKDVDSTSKALNATIKEQVGLLKKDEQAIADYVGAAITLDRILLGAEESGNKLSESMVLVYGSTKGASDVLIDLKNNTSETVAEMIALNGITGEAAEAMRKAIVENDKGQSVLNHLKLGYTDVNGVTQKFTQAQIQLALSMEELQDQSENTDLKALQDSLVKNALLSSKYAKEAMLVVDANIAEEKAKGNLTTASEELAYVQKNLEKQMNKIIHGHKVVVTSANGETRAVHSIRFAIEGLIEAQKEGELTADMFAKALLGTEEPTVKLREALYGMQNSLGGLLDGIKAAKGNMHELQGVAFGLKDELVANSEKIVALGGNSADVAIMIQSVIDQFVASAEAAKLNKGQIDSLLKSAGLLDAMDSIKLKITVDLNQAIAALDAYLELVKVTGQFNRQQLESLEMSVAEAKAAANMVGNLELEANAFKAVSKAKGGSSKESMTLKEATKILNEKIKDQKRALVEAKQALQDYARDSAKALSASVSLGSVFGRMSESMQSANDSRARAAEVAAQKESDALKLQRDAIRSVQEAQNDYVYSLADAVFGVLSLSDALDGQKSAIDALTSAQAQQASAQDKYNKAFDSSIAALTTVAELEREIAGTAGRRRKRELTEQLVKAQKDAAKSTEQFVIAENELKTAIDATNKAGSEQVTFLDNLEKQAAKAQRFSSQIANLVNAGLSKDAIAQIVSAGADAGGEMAQSLLDGGASAIDKANTLVKSIKDSAKTLTDAFAVQIEADMPVYEDVAVSVGETFAESLAAQHTKAKEFTTKVKQLIAFGLRGTQLEEVINAGVDAGTDLADALLAAGETAIRDSVAIQDELKLMSIKFGDELTPYFDQTGVLLAEALLKSLQERLKKLPKTLGGMSGKQINDYMGNLDNVLSDDNNSNAAKIIGTPPTGGSKALANSGQTFDNFKEAVKALHPLAVAKYTSDGTGLNGAEMVALKKQFPKLAATPFASGGIVSKATLGLVGEAGPEAIIPLSKLGNMGGNTSYNITVNAGMGANGAQVGAQIVEAIKKYEKSNGKRWRTS